MNETKKMSLVGFYDFSSKDKTKHFYVVQALFSEIDKSNSSVKSSIINIFTDEKSYNILSRMNIGEFIDVSIRLDVSSGKVFYSIILK